MLAWAAREAPDVPALSAGGQGWTYAAYAGLVAGLAARLAALGCAGQRVALLMSNSVEMAVATFAAQAAGAQVVPLNPFYTPRELRPILADAAPLVVIGDTALSPALAELAAEAGCTVLEGRPGGGLLDPAWPKLGAGALAAFTPQPASLSVLQYTGGTTGRSKGVMLTHAQIATCVEQREARLPTRLRRETVLCVMPMFHSFASAMCLYLAVRAQSRLLVLPRYKPDLAIAAIAAETVTIIPAGPTIFTGLLGAPGFAGLDFSALYACYSGSAPLPEEVLRRWHAVTGSFIYEGYGQTEAGPILTYAGPATEKKVGAVGLPLPGTVVEIVDVAEPGRVVGRGTVGEIRARGPQVMVGYRNLPTETEAALVDGWLYTGDVGVIDEDGYLSIRDRRKDLVIVGGYNVYPREVDEVLYEHPAIAEAAAIGVPDPFYGEVIAGYVVLRAGTTASVQGIIEHCRKNLAPYKVPRHIRVLDRIAKTPAGKIDKVALRSMAVQEDR